MENIFNEMPLTPAIIARRTEAIGLFTQWETTERIKSAR